MGRRARSAVLVPVYFCGEFADLLLQEAQLSQKDRAMLHVIEYFAQSLKVIGNRSIAYGMRSIE